MMYSAAGGALSFVAMYALKKTNVFGMQGVSLLGAVSHNIGQLMVAALVVQTKGLIWYLPPLLAFGAIAGIVIGTAAKGILRILKGNT